MAQSITTKTPKPRRHNNRTKAETERLLDNDFVFFCRALWKVCGYDEFHPIQRADTEMMRWIAGKGTTNHRGSLGPRGIGKTYIACAYAMFRLRQDGNQKVLLMSKSEGHAKSSLLLMRGWTTRVEFMQHLAPNRSMGHVDSAFHFDVGTSTPNERIRSVEVRGIFGQIEGLRAGICIGDDIETEINTISVDMRHRLDERVKELSKVTSWFDREVIYLGTFHHVDTVYAKLHARGYQFMTWPLLYPSQDQRWNKAGQSTIINLCPRIARDLDERRRRPGEKVFPRVADAQIAEQKREGATTFDMHYMLVLPIGDERRYPLKLGDLVCLDAIDKDVAPVRVIWGLEIHGNQSTAIDDLPANGFGTDCFRKPVFWTSDELAAYTTTHMWIDPSGKGSNLTGFCCLGHLNTRLFIKAIGGLEGGYEPPVLHALARTAKANKVHRIFVEDAFGGGMFANLLMPVLQQYFDEGASTEPTSNQISGPVVMEEHRLHMRDRWKGRWACSVEPIPVPKTFNKEARILSYLEPVVQTHHLVVDREIAKNQRFQMQFTRLQNSRGCLEEIGDDEIDSLAGAISTFADRMDVGENDVQQQIRDDALANALDEMQRGNSVGAATEGGPRWFQHR